MLSKNNNNLWNEKMEPKKQRFAIKKFTVGVASVLIGTTFAFYAGGNSVSADDSVNTDGNTVKETVADTSDSERISAKEVTLPASAQDTANTSPDVTEDTQTDSSNMAEDTVSSETTESNNSSVAVADTSDPEESVTKESAQNSANTSSNVTESTQTTDKAENTESSEAKSESAPSLATEETSHLEEGQAVSFRAATVEVAPTQAVGEGTGTLVNQNTKADPVMSDPNGASVTDVTAPAGYASTS